MSRTYLPPKSDVLECGIRCSTLEEAEILLTWAVKNGYPWPMKKTHDEYTYWWKNRESTCYRLDRGTYNSVKGFRGSSIAVFDFDVACKVLDITPPEKKPITDEYIFLADDLFSEFSDRIKKFKIEYPNYTETNFVQYRGDSVFSICFKRDEEVKEVEEFCKLKSN